MIELTKEETLDLLHAQIELEAVFNKRNELLQGVLAKYGVTMDTHNVDLLNGRLVEVNDAESDQNLGD